MKHINEDGICPQDKAVDCKFSVSGDGPPLFLIHGIGGSREIWKYVIPELTGHFTVVSYDLRGHGESPSVDGDFTLEHLVDDLERVRLRTGYEAAHFAGHSLGGMIAPAYALKHASRVSSLGLLSTAAGRSAQDRKNLWKVIDEMERHGVANVLPTLTSRWFTDEFTAAYPDVVAARLKQVLDTPENVFLNVFRIYADTEMISWLHQIQAPALVLTGENDGACSPELNEKIAGELKTSKLVILPNFKHSILLEAGPQVSHHLIDFFCTEQVDIQH